MLISFMLGQFGPWQVVLVIAVVLLLFGGRKIPELMKGLGRGVKEFKDGMKGEEENKPSDNKQIKE
ncbi:MAG: twin-arginine translocase TatA/TatE family subunit [Flavobacteriales bacterium]|nr:twin-arginine translocase TatA/TatE family subunit [Flavobacteriales bacterium]